MKNLLSRSYPLQELEMHRCPTCIALSLPFFLSFKSETDRSSQMSFPRVPLFGREYIYVYSENTHRVYQSLCSEGWRSPLASLLLRKEELVYLVYPERNKTLGRLWYINRRCALHLSSLLHPFLVSIRKAFSCSPFVYTGWFATEIESSRANFLTWIWCNLNLI